MRRFGLAATGGTFDVIHDGHVALLSESFAVSDMVVIGLTSDGLARRRHKRLQNRYPERLSALVGLIEERFAGRRFQISRLEDDFGPAVLRDDMQALIVSSETAPQGGVLNRLRRDRGLGPVEIVTVPMVLAHDGERISSTRIRDGRIDARGADLTKRSHTFE